MALSFVAHDLKRIQPRVALARVVCHDVVVRPAAAPAIVILCDIEQL